MYQAAHFVLPRQFEKNPETASLSIAPRKLGKTPFITEKFESLYPKAQFVKPFQTLDIEYKKVYSYLLKPGQAISRYVVSVNCHLLILVKSIVIVNMSKKPTIIVLNHMYIFSKNIVM